MRGSPHGGDHSTSREDGPWRGSKKHGGRALRRLAAFKAGARGGHREAALLRRLADGLEILGAARAVDGGRRALVGASACS